MPAAQMAKLSAVSIQLALMEAKLGPLIEDLITDC